MPTRCAARTVACAPERINRAQRLPGTPLGNPRRHNRASGAEASLGHVLPRVAAGATSASRASVRAGRRGVLRAWGVQTDASRDSLLSSGSSGSPAHASRRWPRSSTAPSRRSAPDRSTLAPTHVLPDALTQKVREAGRIVSVAALMALAAPFLCFPTSMLAAGHQELAVG